MNNGTAVPANRLNLWSLSAPKALRERHAPLARTSASIVPTPWVSMHAMPPAPSTTSVEFWRDRLAGFPLELALPFSNPRRRLPGRFHATPSIEIPANLLQRMREFARGEVTSIHTLLLAAWQITLFRHSGQNEFVVGCSAPGNVSTIHQRPLLVPASLDEKSTFRDALKMTATRRAEATTHADLAMSDLVHAIDAHINTDRHPVFQTAFIQRNHLASTPAMPVSAGLYSPCELALVWEDDKQTIRLRVEYPVGVIDPDQASRLPNHVLNILRAGTALPGAPVKALPMLTAAEYATQKA